MTGRRSYASPALNRVVRSLNERGKEIGNDGSNPAIPNSDSASKGDDGLE